MRSIPTALEIFAFGEKPEDTFYMLFDKRKYEGEIDVDRLKLTDPRNFDSVLNEMGCVMMMTGDEIEELSGRGDLDASNLKESLVQLAINEGILK